jgi:hypothetical protein
MLRARGLASRVGLLEHVARRRRHAQALETSEESRKHRG